MPDIVDLKFDEDTWDIIIENQDIQFVSGIDATKQYLRQRLGFFRGEDPFDLTRGIPYHDEIFKKRFNPIVIDSIFKEVILNTPGIIELNKFELDYDIGTRELNLVFKVITIEGIIDYTETFIV
jgi:hypothetical protein